MATSKKPSTSVVKETQDKISNTDALQTENKALKQQIEAMQAQMEMLAKQISNINQPTETNSKKPERNIEFINLSPGTLVLKGNQYWKIEGQFNSRVFLEREARIIVNNMQNAIRSGYVYIANSDFVEENDLIDVYASMLSDEQLKNLFNKNFSEIVEIYKTVPKAQKDIIVAMIKDKKESGVAIDANILMQIGELCGQDLLRGIEYEDGE